MKNLPQNPWQKFEACPRISAADFAMILMALIYILATQHCFCVESACKQHQYVTCNVNFSTTGINVIKCDDLWQNLQNVMKAELTQILMQYTCDFRTEIGGVSKNYVFKCYLRLSL